MEHKTTQNKKSFDLKNLVIGLLLGICLSLVMGSSQNNTNGRYQCSADKDQVFIINTQTGHTWKLDRSSTTDFGTPKDRKSQKTSVTPLS